MSKFAKYALILIILIAATLRLYRLTEAPPGVNRDEAAIGFTASSLLTTEKDEYGKKFPISFESFGDWKMPLYIYLDIPFIKAFGESELSVRLPSALAGITGVAAIYFLTYALFASESLALLSSLTLALMPWHIHISRVESESNVAVLMTILGSILLLSALNKKSLKKLVYASLLFAATYYTYHGNHIFTTLLLLGLFDVYRNEIIKVPKWWVAAAIGGLITIVILSATLLGADRTKISGISIFGDPTVVHNNIELPRLLYSNPNSLFVRLIYNRVTYGIETVYQNYLKSYGPDFLFIKGGGNSAHNILGYGNLHPIEAPLLLLGTVWLLLNRKKKGAQLVLWWIAIGAVAAAITKDAPHSNRMFAVVPGLAIAVAAGIVWILSETPKRFHKLTLGIIFVCYAISMIMYLNQYYVHFAKTEAVNWGYGYKKLTPVLFSEVNKNKQVIMTHPENSPYMYILFYSGYSASAYQHEALRYPISSDGFTDVAGFGRFSFRAIDWSKDPSQKNTLLVTKPDELPGALASKIIATIKLPDNSPQFVVVDTDK